jgi:hypothetical protein
VQVVQINKEEEESTTYGLFYDFGILCNTCAAQDNPVQIALAFQPLERFFVIEAKTVTDARRPVLKILCSSQPNS